MKAENSKMVTVIPAEPGWKRVVPNYENPGPIATGLLRQSVIAWHVTITKRGEDIVYTQADPICVECDDYLWVLQSPEGRLFAPEHQDFRNEQEVIDYLNEEFLRGSEVSNNE